MRAGSAVGALIPGNISINVYGAHVQGFDYANLSYRNIDPRGFDAYSLDVLPTRTP